MTNHRSYVVKSNGRRETEEFSRIKLHHSIVAACLSVRVSIGQAEHVAKIVTDAVVAWLADKPEVTSKDIRRVAADKLKTYNPDAAYMYRNHLSTL